MVVEVCVVLVFIPGPFETSVTIPLEVKELVPKRYYGNYDGDHEDGEGGGKDIMVRDVRSLPDGGDPSKKPVYPAGECRVQ